MENEEFRAERAYLARTLRLIQTLLSAETGRHSQGERELWSFNREMWEEFSHFSTDFDRLGEIITQLGSYEMQTAGIAAAHEMIGKYRRLLDAPYFARIEFREDGDEAEKIYIGRYNLMDPDTLESMVYDWRSPVAGMFYRCELGPASYPSPGGPVEGTLTGRRQYKIKNGELSYYLDSSVNIRDEALMDALSQNASARMKTIVETIQHEQDAVIRDTDSELLMVQGAAGSGKTSVALHRTAYLMYEGLHDRLTANDILIIAPNDLFSGYISGVLPELGEKDVRTLLFEDLCAQILPPQINFQSKTDQTEALFSLPGAKAAEYAERVDFKGSQGFITLLSRLASYYIRRMHPFEDVDYAGECVYSGEMAKAFILNNKYRQPAGVRLSRLRQRILDQVHERHDPYVARLAEKIKKSDPTNFRPREYARLFSMLKTASITRVLDRVTAVDCFSLYRRLFSDPGLLSRLARGLTLPAGIGRIVAETDAALQQPKLPYEDAVALSYLAATVNGAEAFKSVRQVVVDEAQDYSPMHYALLRECFPTARYTVMGDVDQALTREAGEGFYEEVAGLLKKDSHRKLTLRKSYRSTREIMELANGILGAAKAEPFDRHGRRPELLCAQAGAPYVKLLTDTVKSFREGGLPSIAVLCRSRADADALRPVFPDALDTYAPLPDGGALHGLSLLPIYLARGLEFDAVVVTFSLAGDCRTAAERRLLYVACTRALHRLAVCCEGSPSPALTQIFQSVQD